MRKATAARALSDRPPGPHTVDAISFGSEYRSQPVVLPATRILSSRKHPSTVLPTMSRMFGRPYVAQAGSGATSTALGVSQDLSFSSTPALSSSHISLSSSSMTIPSLGDVGVSEFGDGAVEGVCVICIRTLMLGQTSSSASSPRKPSSCATHCQQDILSSETGRTHQQS